MDEIESLKEENKCLKDIIKSLTKQLDSYKMEYKKQYKYNEDYLPYQEDRDRRD